VLLAAVHGVAATRVVDTDAAPFAEPDGLRERLAVLEERPATRNPRHELAGQPELVGDLLLGHRRLPAEPLNLSDEPGATPPDPVVATMASRRQRLHVIRVDARGVLAAMVQVVAIRDLATDLEPYLSVRLTVVRAAIAAMLEQQPVPAAGFGVDFVVSALAEDRNGTLRPSTLTGVTESVFVFTHGSALHTQPPRPRRPAA
jgi:hypothetical protein